MAPAIWLLISIQVSYRLLFGQKEIAMLILTRRIGETIIIELPDGERIQVVVLGAKGNQVRIGTEASGEIQIMREELLETSLD